MQIRGNRKGLVLAPTLQGRPYVHAVGVSGAPQSRSTKQYHILYDCMLHTYTYKHMPYTYCFEKVKTHPPFSRSMLWRSESQCKHIVSVQDRDTRTLNDRLWMSLTILSGRWTSPRLRCTSELTQWNGRFSGIRKIHRTTAFHSPIHGIAPKNMSFCDFCDVLVTRWSPTTEFFPLLGWNPGAHMSASFGNKLTMDICGLLWVIYGW